VAEEVAPADEVVPSADEAPPAEEFALVDPELLPFPWQEAKRSKAASETTKETFFFFMVFPFIQAAFPEKAERSPG
jgi:hypothetical protein